MSYVTTDTFDRFNALTGLRAETVQLAYLDFYENYYDEFISYYQNELRNVSDEALESYATLKKQVAQIDSYITTEDDRFNRYDFWDLFDQLDEIKDFVKKTDAISRFMRSTRIGKINESDAIIDYSVMDGQTPEQLSEPIGFNPQNDWFELYRDNGIAEINYEAGTGGYIIKLPTQSGNNSILLASIVDNLIGDNLYGKDLHLSIELIDNDLLVLSPRDTFKQGVLVYSKLLKGQIPESPELGISPELVKGSNVGLLNMPFIIKEMTETFSTDDTMINFKVNNVERKGSALFLIFEVESFRNLIEESKIETR